MNEQLKKTFKQLEGKPVEIAMNTHVPVPHTSAFNVYYMRGTVIMVGTLSFILRQGNKAIFYADLDDVFYFTDISEVESAQPTETPPSQTAPVQNDS
jgi:hypothetical protein